LIKLEWIQKEVRWSGKMLIEEESLKKRIKKVQKKDKRVVKAVEELKRLGAKMLKKKEWLIKEELVLKKD